MLRIAFFALGLLSASTTTAAELRYLTSDKEVRKEVDGLMQLLADAKSPEFFEQIRTVTLVSADGVEDLELQWQTHQKNLIRSYGMPFGYELVRERLFGTRLKKLEYLLLHERSPMLWTFTLYRTESGWIIRGAQYSHDVEELFRGGGKP